MNVVELSKDEELSLKQASGRNVGLNIQITK